MPAPISRLACILLSSVLLTSCASSGKMSGRNETTSITRGDIEQGGAGIFTAREAVRVLRPQWLSRPMGRVASSNVMDAGGGAQDIIVYINDVRQPEYDALATVSAARILEIKYLDQNRAVLLHGPGHEGGVIEVTTVDKRK